MAEFETSVTVPCSIEQAFDFLLRPANVARISPPSVGLQFVSAPDVVQVGSQITFRVQAYGQVQTFTHGITAIERPTLIVEHQVEGLFKKWVHEHAFESTPEGTQIIDRIDFEPPSGLLGLLLTKKKILEQLEDAYYHRHRHLQKLLQATG